MDNNIQKYFTFKDINFDGIISELINNLLENDDTMEDLNDQMLPFMVNFTDMEDFNNRKITPSNINQIIKICDYLLVKDTKDFLIKYSTPTIERYNIDNYELSDKKKYILPIFMTKGIEINYYNSMLEESILYDNEEEYFISNYYENFDFIENALQEMVSLNAINWIEHFLEHFKKQDNKWIIKHAVIKNNRECIKFILMNKLDLLGPSATETAALTGNLEMLKFLRQNGCVWNSRTCTAAAHNGSLECLKYAHFNGCPWDEHTLCEAARNNNIDCIKYAISNQCPLFGDEADSYFEGPCMLAAANNNIECLKLCYNYGCDIEAAIIVAARYGNLDIVKYIYENYDVSDDFVLLSREAIKSGDLETLKFTHQVIKSSLLEKDNVMYCYRKEKEHCTLIASTLESPNILNYLIENNIKLDKECLKYAIKACSENCINYILNLPQNVYQIPMDYNYINLALSTGNLNILKYIYSQFPSMANLIFEPLYTSNLKCWEFAMNKNLKFNQVHFIEAQMHLYYNWFYDLEFVRIIKKLKLFSEYDIIKIISYFGQIELLKYFYKPEYNIKEDINTLICKDIMNINLINFDKMPDKLSCLKYGIMNNWPISNNICNNCSDTNIIKYLLDNNVVLDNNMVYYNLINRKYDFVDYLISKGFQIDANMIEILIKHYSYNRQVNNFIVTGININQDHKLFIKVLNYLENCSQLKDNLFITCLYTNCFEIIPALLNLKCPISMKIIKKYIDDLNLANDISRNNFLVNIIKTLINNYDDFEVTEELFCYASRPYFSPVLKDFLIQKKCPGYDKTIIHDDSLSKVYERLNS